MERRIRFTSAEDELLARGWPRCIDLVDGHPDARRPATSAAAYFSSKRWYGAEWPREVAYQVLHGSSSRVSKNEAVTLLAGALGGQSDLSTRAQHIADLIYIVERIAGTNETLETIASAFEAANTKRVPSPAFVAAPSTLAFLMLRASVAVRAQVRTRLEAQADRIERAGWEACTRNFGLSLRGAAAVKDLVWRKRAPDLELLDHAHDDAEFVRLLAARHPLGRMSVRAVQIGGLATMVGLSARCLHAFPARAFPILMRDFGMVRAPETVDLALSLVGRTHVKDAPIRWLVTHADYTRPIVEDLARTGSPLAKTVLRRLVGAW